MIKHRIIALTGILILTAVSITGCKGIKKETGSSSVVESVEEKATETASKEEPEVGMGNPWVEITEEEAKKTCVRLFKAPDGSTDQVWQKCESLGDPEKGIQPLLQLNFKLDDMDFTARAQYGAAEDADISGIYTEWTEGPDDVTLANWGGGNMTGKTYRSVDDLGYTDLITWYDIEIGIKYSLSVTADDLDGFDIQAVAEQMYSPENEPDTGSEDDEKTPEGDRITDEEALSAVKNYCHENNPDLESIEKEGEYPVYWDIESSDETEIVVLFRSYTGAEIRYHINPVSGDTSVTEFVSGITTEEEKTDESFNIRDYLTGNGSLSDKSPSITGTWETGSIGYAADDGTVQPLYYVQFTDSEINYGHLKEGKFVSEYSDKICLMEETGDSRYRVQAEASNGGKYTYQTCETDKDTLEYYDAWDEKEFPEKYSGGASLTRSSNQ